MVKLQIKICQVSDFVQKELTCGSPCSESFCLDLTVPGCHYDEVKGDHVREQDNNEVHSKTQLGKGKPLYRLKKMSHIDDRTKMN